MSTQKDSPSELNNLPLELLDTILRKSYLHWALSEDLKLNRPVDEDIIIVLASVDHCWYKRIFRQSFRNAIRRRLFENVYYETQIAQEVSAQVDYGSEPVLLERIKPKSGIEDRAIYGLTVLDHELFIVVQINLKIEVYDTMKLSFCRRFEMNELCSPLDIASCNRNKCLYVVNYNNHCQRSEILRADPDGKLRNFWTLTADFVRLSVNDESNVIATFNNGNRISEYSPDGKLIREIKLPSGDGFVHPYRAVQLTSGLIVVSHGNVGDSLHRVCLVDADGEALMSFGGASGSTIGQLNVPGYFAVDANGWVIVSDQYNSRVLLLDSNLECKRKLVSKEKHGLRLPSRICLDESNGRLFVGEGEWVPEKHEWRDNHVLAFALK